MRIIVRIVFITNYRNFIRFNYFALVKSIIKYYFIKYIHYICMFRKLTIIY
nr:MAG TPA: hypothetical protein [Bacteriophage sp.]